MELELATTCRGSLVEHALIAALATRFPTDDPSDAETLAAGHAAYAEAMAELARVYPPTTSMSWRWPPMRW